MKKIFLPHMWSILVNLTRLNDVFKRASSAGYTTDLQSRDQTQMIGNGGLSDTDDLSQTDLTNVIFFPQKTGTIKHFPSDQEILIPLVLARVREEISELASDPDVQKRYEDIVAMFRSHPRRPRL